jgi:hypothetical protein
MISSLESDESQQHSAPVSARRDDSAKMSPYLDWVPFLIAAVFAALLFFILQRSKGDATVLKTSSRIASERWKNWRHFR